MQPKIFQSHFLTVHQSSTLWKAVLRHGARTAAWVVLGVAGVGSVQAQAYPSKPVRVVVAFTAGGSTDILTRLVSQQLIREGADPMGGTPAQFAQFVQREYEKWKVIVLESGARAE